MKAKTIQQIIDKNLCVGCGLCSSDPSVCMMTKDGMIKPNTATKTKSIELSCPSKGYDLKTIGKRLFGDVNYKYELGYYRNLWLTHTNNKGLLQNASSGGIMSQIALSMLSTGVVDGVITTVFTYTSNQVRTETIIASNEQELISGQGSKYCPTSTLSILKELDPCKKYLLIGTPCQIAGFRLYSQIEENLKAIIPFTISNFCGGYRDYRELDYFVTKVAHISDVVFFRHRGGGQPGSMKIEGKNNEVFQYPYPEYAKLSNYVKNERCTLCMDATGELADFSCGDAWLEHKDKSSPWSIVIARSEFASCFLEELIKRGDLSKGEDISADDVIESQRSNITSKKYRQFKRIKVRDFLLRFSPNWYDNYDIKSGTYLGEFRIILAKFKSRLIKRW